MGIHRKHKEQLRFKVSSFYVDPVSHCQPCIYQPVRTATRRCLAPTLDSVAMVVDRGGSWCVAMAGTLKDGQ